MKNTKKQTALLVSVVLLLTVTVGGTLAYLVAETGALENIFTPAQVSCEVNESFDETTKSNIQIQNTSNTEAYVRVMVIPTWQNSEGIGYFASNPLPTIPTLEEDLGENWEYSDGYYYYTISLQADDNNTTTTNDITTVLFDDSITSTNSPEGYYLVVDIIADAIQADPFEDYEHAWNTAMDETGGTN